jgi:hypothetical protein
VGRVIDHRQVLDAASFGRAVKDKVHRPHLVGCHRALQRVALGQRDLLALALFDLQARLSVQAVNTLVVDDLASLAQLQVNHTGAISAVALGQGNDLLL